MYGEYIAGREILGRLLRQMPDSYARAERGDFMKACRTAPLSDEQRRS